MEENDVMSLHTPSIYIYQVKNHKYANSFCHNKISGNGAVL